MVGCMQDWDGKGLDNAATLDVKRENGDGREESNSSISGTTNHDNNNNVEMRLGGGSLTSIPANGPIHFCHDALEVKGPNWTKL